MNRLPRILAAPQAEWEAAVQKLDVEGNFLDLNRLRPKPASPRKAGVQQMFGDVWEWTRSPFSPYPRFRAVDGAVGDYNGKFMSGQFVLRGGSCVTRRDTSAHLPQFLPGAHALAIRRTLLGGGRVAPAQSVKPQGETR